MAYYSPLASEWAAITAANPSYTTAQKLAAINAMTVAGPNVDVSTSSVLGYLMMNVKLVTLQEYAASPPNGSSPTVVALVKELLATFSYPAFQTFQTSQASVYSTVSGMLSTIAGDANTGITSADVTAILALAQTTILWWQANGYTSPINDNDLMAAGGLT